MTNQEIIQELNKIILSDPRFTEALNDCKITDKTQDHVQFMRMRNLLLILSKIWNTDDDNIIGVQTDDCMKALYELIIILNKYGS